MGLPDKSEYVPSGTSLADRLTFVDSTATKSGGAVGTVVTLTRVLVCRRGPWEELRLIRSARLLRTLVRR